MFVRGIDLWLFLFLVGFLGRNLGAWELIDVHIHDILTAMAFVILFGMLHFERKDNTGSSAFSRLVK